MLSVSRLVRRFYVDYDEPSKHFTEEARALTREDMAVLHAGCGADDSIGFRTAGRITIGVDRDEGILSNTDVDLAVLGDLSSLPLADGCVGVIAAKWVLEHLSRPGMFMREVARVLEPGGRLVILTPNLWHYTASVIRVTPHWLHRWFVSKALKGDPEKVFPVFYRANTARRIRFLAAKAGLAEVRLKMLEGSPRLLAFSPLVFLVGIAYERLANRFELLGRFRMAVLAVFRRPELPGRLGAPPPAAGGGVFSARR